MDHETRPRPNLPDPFEPNPVEQAKALTPPYVPSSAGLTDYERRSREALAKGGYVKALPPVPEPQWLPVQGESAARGWYTIPKPVRFAVWVWAVSVILGLIGAVGIGLFWLITAGAVISQM